MNYKMIMISVVGLQELINWSRQRMARSGMINFGHSGRGTAIIE